MKQVKIITVSVLLLILSACANVQRSLQDIQYSVDGPNVTYQQNKVRVVYNNYHNAPFRQGQRVYLLSEQHGGVVSYAQFRTFKPYPAAPTFSLEAVLPMPAEVPVTAENSCFFLAGTPTGENVLAVRSAISEAGFINEIWQANVARDAQLNYLGEALDVNTNAEQLLRSKHDDARAFLSNSDIYKNNMCALPDNDERKPTDPLHGAFKDTLSTGYAVCHVVQYRDIPPEKRQKYYFDAKNRKFNRHEANNHNITRAIEEIVKLQHQNNDVKTMLMSLYQHASKIYRATENSKEQCTAFSTCDIYDELFYGSTHRDIDKNYKQCATMVSGRLKNMRENYEGELKDWEQAPYIQQAACETQKQTADNFQHAHKQLQLQRQKLQAELQRIQRVQKVTSPNAQWRNGTSSTCPVGASI